MFASNKGHRKTHVEEAWSNRRKQLRYVKGPPSSPTADDPRSPRAESLIAEGGVIGVQVLNEFTKVTHRKLRWNWDQIEASLAVVEELFGPVAPLTAAIHARAVILARERKLSVYDALIVAAAQDAGCQLLFSEDLQHGQKFGTLTVENPFRREAY